MDEYPNHVLIILIGLLIILICLQSIRVNKSLFGYRAKGIKKSWKHFVKRLKK